MEGGMEEWRGGGRFVTLTWAIAPTLPPSLPVSLADSAPRSMRNMSGCIPTAEESKPQKRQAHKCSGV